MWKPYTSTKLIQMSHHPRLEYGKDRMAEASSQRTRLLRFYLTKFLYNARIEKSSRVVKSLLPFWSYVYKISNWFCQNSNFLSQLLHHHHLGFSMRFIFALLDMVQLVSYYVIKNPSAASAYLRGVKF